VKYKLYFVCRGRGYNNKGRLGRGDMLVFLSKGKQKLIYAIILKLDE
jgi:hypothetical protein